MPLKLKVKNKKLAILSVLLIMLLAALGLWQLSRAEQKKALLASFAARVHAAPLTAAGLLSQGDHRFYQAALFGVFDNAHTYLLDNKIFHHQIGYEVYTPFKVKGLHQAILVDRGFIPMGPDRRALPLVPAVSRPVVIKGLINLPPRYVALGAMQAFASTTWPLLVEFVDIPLLEKHLSYPLLPLILSLPPQHPYAFSAEWQVVTMPPEKHIAYAIQWFALAITLLILSAVLCL